jgi:enoyl-CoA hydratase
MSILTESRDGVLVLTINRPDAGNSLDPQVGNAMLSALEDADQSDDVRTIVITGAGEKIFSAGMDLRAFASGADMAPVQLALARLAGFRKPVIAAVNGSAVAGGFEIVMRADLVVAADHAKFGIPEVKRGLVAVAGGTRLPRRIPLAVALELGLTGEPISAQRAFDLGLINRVAPSASVMDEALHLASLVAANGPLAVRATKQLMREELGADTSERVNDVCRPVFDSEDAREGTRAFAERRAPIWTGR